jgi:gluconate 2-dehydrogenase gamma chain
MRIHTSMQSDQRQPSRRFFLKSIGTTTAASAAFGVAKSQGQQEGKTAAGPLDPAPRAYTFLLPDEAAFVEAAVDVLIPKDEVGPGGVEAGVCYFIDQQLSGAFGIGGGMNLQGPFAAGMPTQGYQLPFTPQQIYRIGIQETNDHCRRAYGGRTFAGLTASERNTVLQGLQSGKITLVTVVGRLFMSTLLANTMEGYFADPAYGGNRGKAVWRMLGFPGVGQVYTDAIGTFRGRRQVLDPQSLSDFR